MKNPRNLASGGICKKSEDRGNMNIFSIDLELWKESLTSQGMARRDRFLLHFPQRRTVVYGACQKSKPGSIFCNLLPQEDVITLLLLLLTFFMVLEIVGRLFLLYY